MTKSLFRCSMAAMVLAMVSATGAEAQLTLDTPPVCSDWVGGGYTQCGGAFAGNDSNQDVAGWLLTNWGFNTTGTAKYEVPSSVDISTGTLVFSDFSGFSGTGISGIFVLSLKAADRFSLYQFDTGGAPLTSLDFNTLGSSVNKNGKAQGLSHATLYMGTSTVPEPVSMMLLGTGLAGLGVLSLRRRKKETEQV